MDTKAILKVLHTQLAIEDPEAFGQTDNPISTVTAEPLLELIDSVVDNVAEQIGDDAPEYESTLAVSAALGQAADMLARAATVLWQSGYFKHKNYDRSPHLAATTPKQGKEFFKAYIATLQKLKEVTAPFRYNAQRIPVTPDIGEELDALPDVFAFLTERREQLRKLRHSTACQHKGALRYTETGADRADQMATYYNIYLGGELAEDPENWTLRNKPDCLRPTLVSLLSDLHHLTDASEVNWKQLLGDAQRMYKDELEQGEE